MGREIELIRARRNHPRMDVEDLEGNVNRANAEKTFQAVFFLFLIHCFHYPSKIRSRILMTQLLIL